MKFCAVTRETVVIPVMPDIRGWHDQSVNPLEPVEIERRYVYLKPREIDGHIVLAAYDRETDTLFIKNE